MCSETGDQQLIQRVTGRQYQQVWTKDAHGGPYRKVRLSLAGKSHERGRDVKTPVRRPIFGVLGSARS